MEAKVRLGRVTRMWPIPILIAQRRPQACFGYNLYKLYFEAPLGWGGELLPETKYGVLLLVYFVPWHFGF